MLMPEICALIFYAECATLSSIEMEQSGVRAAHCLGLALVKRETGENPVRTRHRD